MYKFIALILLFVTNEAIACSCKKAEPSEYFAQAANINYGRVVGLEIFIDDSGSEFQKVLMANPETLKGDNTSVVFSRLDDGSCRGNSYMLGYHYVIFTTEDNWTTGVCGGTEVILPQMSFSQDYLNKLREISPNKAIKPDS